MIWAVQQHVVDIKDVSENTYKSTYINAHASFPYISRSRFIASTGTSLPLRISNPLPPFDSGRTSYCVATRSDDCTGAHDAEQLAFRETGPQRVLDSAPRLPRRQCYRARHAAELCTQLVLNRRVFCQEGQRPRDGQRGCIRTGKHEGIDVVKNVVVRYLLFGREIGCSIRFNY